LFQFGERRSCTIFTKIMTKLRQKLKYKDQNENEEMTPDIIMTRDIVIATSLNHCHMARRQRDMWQIFIFFKK